MFQDGVYVKGLFLQGAGWEKKNSVLIEADPMQLVCAMPSIHFKPTETKKKSSKGRAVRVCVSDCECECVCVLPSSHFKPTETKKTSSKGRTVRVCVKVLVVGLLCCLLASFVGGNVV